MDSLRVLVIDDEAGMRHSIARALRDYIVRLPDVEGEVRFELEQAGTGEEGLAKIESHAPDILLLDYKLPDTTGVEILEQLRQRGTQPLTVMVTAYASLDTAIRATKSGAHDFLAKPFTPSELKETLRKAAEHLIIQRQARRLTEEKQQVRFQFISVLGHELKAPLSAIEGYLSILRDRCCGEQVSAYDEVIGRCLVRAEGMRKLILDLLDMTRIESGQKRRELAEMDLVAAVRAAIETVTPDADARGIRIALESDEHLAVIADRGEIEMIFNNLLSNAVKYNRDQGSVNVRLSASPEVATITVADTGIGMSEEECARLFNDFVRIKNDKTRSILGSGLGLSLMRKLARINGGDAVVTSKPDVGTTFTVTLNRRPAEVKSDGPKRDPALAATG